jgi:hypothetical protein
MALARHHHCNYSRHEHHHRRHHSHAPYVECPPPPRTDGGPVPSGARAHPGRGRRPRLVRGQRERGAGTRTAKLRCCAAALHRYTATPLHRYTTTPRRAACRAVLRQGRVAARVVCWFVLRWPLQEIAAALKVPVSAYTYEDVYMGLQALKVKHPAVHAVLQWNSVRVGTGGVRPEAALE